MHFENLNAIFILFRIAIWKLFHFGKVKNLSFRKGLKHKYCRMFGSDGRMDLVAVTKIILRQNLAYEVC